MQLFWIDVRSRVACALNAQGHSAFLTTLGNGRNDRRAQTIVQCPRASRQPSPTGLEEVAFVFTTSQILVMISVYYGDQSMI